MSFSSISQRLEEVKWDGSFPSSFSRSFCELAQRWHASTFGGNRTHPRHFVNIIFNGATNAVSLSFIILTHISSHPCALLGLSDRMIFSIFSSEITKVSIRVEFMGLCSGVTLPASIIVHWSIIVMYVVCRQIIMA